MRIRLASVISVLAVLSGVSAANARGQSARGSAPPAPNNPVAVNAESIAAGKQVFDKYCKFCHGADAKGNGPLAPQGTHPPDLTDAVWEHGSTDGEIYLNIRNGIAPKMDMKAFKSRLTDKEMWSVINYVRGLGPAAANK